MGKKSDEDITSLFLNKKPAKAIIVAKELDESYATKISDRIDSTYAHTSKILTNFEELGLLRKEKRGRKNVIVLTDIGEKVAESLEDSMDVLEEAKNRNESEKSEGEQSSSEDLNREVMKELKRLREEVNSLKKEKGDN